MRWPGTDRSAASWPKELQNSRSWVSLIVHPGEAPLEALAAAITRLWQLDAKDPDQAALPRKWAKGLAVGDNTLADLVDATQEELKRRVGGGPRPHPPLCRPGRGTLHPGRANGREAFLRTSGKRARRQSPVRVWQPARGLFRQAAGG